MLREMKKWAHAHCEGLITDREFLSHVLNAVGARWADMPETSNNDSDVKELSKALDGLLIQ